MVRSNTSWTRRRFAALGATMTGAASAGMAQALSGRRFSYIVVGGGSAGCVLARRLSDDAAHDVLLLEAGQADQPPAVDIPARWFSLSGTEIDWRFKSLPQAHAASRPLDVPRGKILGGSSVINAMVHHRGADDDYDRWEALGALGWNASSMAPMFRRSEAWRGAEDHRRGTTGPVVISPVSAPTPAALRFIDGAQTAGYRRRDDLNVDPGAGASLNQVAFDGRYRMSSYRAYLVPIAGRPNLTILTGADVVGLEMRGSRCVGVRYRRDGEERTAGVEREVVLAAGAIQSPQILMLSGMGPAAELGALGVKPIVDLPQVGHNLHEHLIFPGISIETSSPFPPSKLMGTDAVLYARSGQSVGRRDILLNFSANGLMGPGLDSVSAGCKTSFAYLKPKSRGKVSLAVADPTAAPQIDFNALAHPEDVRGSVVAFEIGRSLLNGPAFADVRLREVNPGPSTMSRSAIIAYLAQTGVTFGHSVGTCRMGTDDQAVVDPELRVRGVESLRVADASIIPEIPSAPTNATVLAIAERASELISSRPKP